MVAAKRYGFEFKYADAPGRSRSMHTAIQDLSLEHLWVIYPGHEEYPLDDKISVLPINSLPRIVNGLQESSLLPVAESIPRNFEPIMLKYKA